MTLLSPPQVPWQVTGNHWLALPCIHPADGAIHAVGLLHRGARAAIEFAGAPDFTSGAGPALLRPVLRVDGQRRELAAESMAWERALGWLPTFTSATGTLVVRGTVFAPYGRDADLPGALYAISVESRGSAPVDVVLSIEGTLGHRQQRVRTPRPCDDAHRVVQAANDVIIMDGSSLPGLAALALGADGPATVEVTQGPAPTFALRRTFRLAPGGREQCAFYLAAGPERDGAEATVAAMRRRGWRDLLSATRDALQTLEQTTGNDVIDRVVNRNLLFSYFYGVGRALDDAHYYVVRSRAPWNGRGITVHDWDALCCLQPAVQLADPALARELLLRMCEIHGYAPGRGTNYLDGTLFEPGFSIEGCASYAIAIDRYIRETGDDEIVDEPVLADTLYVSWEDLETRRDQRVPLYGTEVMPSGRPAPYPFTLHGNAVAGLALEVFRRTLDEETARDVGDADAVRASLKRHFLVEREARITFAEAIDLGGGVSLEDDPLGSALWLPLYDAVDRQDSVYRRTVKSIPSEPHFLARQCARLVGPESDEVLAWLRRAPLDNGIAAEVVDPNGRAVANGGDATLAGLLAWCIWYAVHALGVRA